MFKSRKAAIAAIAVMGAMAATVGTAHAKKCVLAGGQGNGITKDVAGYMAKAALAQSITKLGMKAAGKVKMSCKYDLVISTCTAKQRACK